MYFAKALLCTLLPSLSFAQGMSCGDQRPSHANLLTDEQWRGVLAMKESGDPVIDEAIAIEHVKQRNGPTPKDKPMRIDWPNAKKLILLGTILKVMEYENKSVILISVSGKKYGTMEPAIDDVWGVTNVVDPCNVFILHIAE